MPLTRYSPSMSRPGRGRWWRWGENTWLTQPALGCDTSHHRGSSVYPRVPTVPWKVPTAGWHTVTATCTAVPVPRRASTGIPEKTQPPHFSFTQSCPQPRAPRVVPVPRPQGSTSPLHGLDALQDEARHRPPLPLAQRLQGAAENLIWKNQRGLEHDWLTPKGRPAAGQGWGTELGTSWRVPCPCGRGTGVAGGDGTCPSPSP